MTKEEFDKLFPQVAESAEKAQSKELAVQTTIEWHIARFGCVTGSRDHRISFVPAKKADGTSRAAKCDWMQENAPFQYAKLMHIGYSKGKDVAALPVKIIDDIYNASSVSLEPSAKTINFANELASELLLDLDLLRQSETVPRWLDSHSASTRWGHENEPKARQYFAEQNPHFEVVESEQLQHPTLSFVKYNPDGLIYENGKLTGLVEIKCPWNPSVHMATLKSKAINDTKHLKQIVLGMICSNANFCKFISFDPRVRESAKMVVVTKTRQDLREDIEQMEFDLRMFWGDVYYPLLAGMVQSGALESMPKF